MFIVLVDGRFDQVVDVATMFTCTLFPSHRIRIVYTRIFESLSLPMTMLISFDLLWIISWLYPCRQIRFNRQLDRVTHRCCSSPGSFHRIFLHVRFFIVLMKLRRMCRKSYCFLLQWTMTTTGYLFFSFQLPGVCGSGFMWKWCLRILLRQP